MPHARIQILGLIRSPSVRERCLVLQAALSLIHACTVGAVQPQTKARPPSASQITTAQRTIPGFSIRRQEPGWSLVSPEGKPFFSLGVCCVHQGTAREGFDPENPGYAAWQHYQD